MLNESEFKGVLDDMLPSGRHYPTPPEEALRGYISSLYDEEREIQSEHYQQKDFIDPDAVVAWLSKNEPAALHEFLGDPELMAGTAPWVDALKALGYYTEWEKVTDPDNLDRDDYERWQESTWGNHE